jgi:hypothetical protein
MKKCTQFKSLNKVPNLELYMNIVISQITFHTQVLPYNLVM